MSINKYYNLAKNTLYPICRSLTGKGTKKTLSIIKNEFPSLKIYNVSSRSKVFDWNVPDEWNVSDAYVLDKKSNKIIDFKLNNLHLIGYSIPVNKIINKVELFKHLHSLPKQPEAIPYITSYYKKYWGFCVSHSKKLQFDKNYKNSDKFKVVIKSNLNSKGHLNYGELILNGKSKQEILISTYICHPSMANNELSGPVVATALAKWLNSLDNLRYSYRFVFVPAPWPGG